MEVWRLVLSLLLLSNFLTPKLLSAEEAKCKFSVKNALIKKDAKTGILSSFPVIEKLPSKITYESASYMETLVSIDSKRRLSNFELQVQYEGKSANFKKTFPLVHQAKAEQNSNKTSLITHKTIVFVRDILPEEEHWPGSLTLGLLENNNLICTSHAVQLIFGE